MSILHGTAYPTPLYQHTPKVSPLLCYGYFYAGQAGLGPMARHVNSALRRRIGTRLRELRLAAGITSQEALAHRVGVHATYIGRLERGESGVTLEVLSAVLAAMSMSLAEFFEPFDQVIRPRRLPRQRT